ncbi:MAG: glycosyl transferase family 36, partial [Planctomycetes bacterium]|nr:glycosyl transferase family 36 [Planctomycetota bacterium]
WDEVAAVHLVREAVRPVSRRLTTPDTPAPRTHLLSNREHTVMVTNAGTGFSQCRGTLLTRWRPDSTRDPWGHFLYVRDGRSGLLWSAGFQPVRKWPDRYEVIFSSDRAEIRRWDGEVETHLQITVSPEDNTEIRQLTVTNHGKRPREIEVTTYAELALAPYGADLAHPAFNKLFIQTEALPDGHGLLATRRARDAKQEPVWLAYVLAVDQPLAAPVTYETDRARFLGRGRTPANPAALDPNVALSGTTGAVLDPILSLRCLVRLRPGQSAQLAFNLAVARSREEALMLADRFHDPRVVLRTLELAWAHSQVELRHHQLSPGEAHLFQRLASPLFYPDPSRRAPAPVLAANRQGQAYLWRYGISGDYPLVLVRLTNPGQIALIREVLLAHEFWRSKGLIAELVILNDQPASYLDQVTEQLHGLIQGISSRDLMDKRGGIFLLRGTQVPEADRVLLQAAASVYLHGERGPLARQVEQALPPVNLPGRLPLKISEPQPAAAAVPPPPLPPLFANGLGGFSADGREYVINLAPGQWTPAPWSNVIANPHFGFLISEAGGGYTWSENSRENKLTPWANDPVADTPGEVVYLRDEETGELWSPTPLPMGGSATFTVHHGQGYTRFEHQSHGLAQQLLYSLPPADSVKFLCLRLRNLSNRTRKLSATFYVEWVLGVARDQTQLHVVTEADDQTGALLARNGYNQDFGNRVAFLTILGRPQTVTGDRTEFLGRNGGYDRPAALARVELSDRLGPGFDPCGAVQTKLELPPGQVTEVIFLLGQEGNLPAVHHLLERYRTPEAVHAAIAQTQAFWENLLNTVQVKTPDQALDLLLNRWLLYQVLSCRLWGRSALYQSGGAYGFRDQLQDVMALVYGAPQLTRAQILRSAARQFEEGDVQHWWHPPVNRGIRTRFSDDYLFLPFVTCHYLRSTGDRAILEERLPFLHSPLLEPHEEERYELPEVSPQVDTLYQHCLRAIDHGFRFGVHGLPLMGCGDWNDGMNKVGAGGQGESVWVAWFLVTILDQFAPLVEERGDSERAAIYRAKAVQLRQAIDEQAWDGQWYRRAYYDDGTPLGSAANEECRIDSLVQSWAVIAGGNPERARQAMAAVDEYLVKREERLLLLFTPPFDQTPHDPGYIKGYLPGVRENGGQYTHAALWVVQAFALLGDGDKAWELLNLLNPIHHGDSERVEAVYKVEPYVIAADVYSRRPHTGRGGWTWYTGSAGWVYRVALESLLGFQLHGHRLRLEPCIPAAWPGFELTYHHGQTVYRIVVDNPEHVQHGVGEVLLDGKVLPDGEVLLTEDGGTHEVRVRMGEKKDHGSHG